jgi:hypothetical protein
MGVPLRGVGAAVGLVGHGLFVGSLFVGVGSRPVPFPDVLAGGVLPCLPLFDCDGAGSGFPARSLFDRPMLHERCAGAAVGIPRPPPLETGTMWSA